MAQPWEGGRSRGRGRKGRRKSGGGRKKERVRGGERGREAGGIGPEITWERTAKTSVHRKDDIIMPLRKRDMILAGWCRENRRYESKYINNKGMGQQMKVKMDRGKRLQVHLQYL